VDFFPIPVGCFPVSRASLAFHASRIYQPEVDWKNKRKMSDNFSYCLLEQLSFIEEEKRKTTVFFLAMDFRSKENLYLTVKKCPLAKKKLILLGLVKSINSINFNNTWLALLDSTWDIFL
jgi:hypothetical protein